MDEEQITTIAKFYHDTKTWRGELQLAGCEVVAKYIYYNHDQFLEVGDSHRKLGWWVCLEGQRFLVKSFRRYDPKGYYCFDTAEEVMTFLSEKLRYE
jgi:hypothetical protein